MASDTGITNFWSLQSQDLHRSIFFTFLFFNIKLFGLKIYNIKVAKVILFVKRFLTRKLPIKAKIQIYLQVIQGHTSLKFEIIRNCLTMIYNFNQILFDLVKKAWVPQNYSISHSFIGLDVSGLQSPSGSSALSPDSQLVVLEDMFLMTNF